MPWDRELYVLEEAIRRLGAEYDAFFYGSVSKPPVESRKHVEQMIRQLGGMAADSAADRYRFSTLQGRYNALCDRWERLQEEKEAGRRPGLYGHFTDGGRNPPLPRPPPRRPPRRHAQTPRRPPPYQRDEGEPRPRRPRGTSSTGTCRPRRRREKTSADTATSSSWRASRRSAGSCRSDWGAKISSSTWPSARVG